MNKLPRSLKQFSKDHKEEMSRSDKFSIDPRLIKARADFNVREIEQMSKEERAAYDEYIDQLAQAYRDGRYTPTSTESIYSDASPVISSLVKTK